MKVRELIEALQKMPPEAEVEVEEYVDSSDWRGYSQRDPRPTLEDDGSFPDGHVTL